MMTVRFGNSEATILGGVWRSPDASLAAALNAWLLWYEASQANYLPDADREHARAAALEYGGTIVAEHPVPQADDSAEILF